MSSAAGHLLRRALTLDFALEKHISVPLSKIPADEFITLQVLQSERNRYQQEQMDKAQQGQKNGH